MAGLIRAAFAAILRRRQCPWCDDPDCIDSERCNCTVQCPMSLCNAAAVQRG